MSGEPLSLPRSDKAASDFIHGGTTQNDYIVSVVKRLTPDLELKAYGQFEGWLIPVYNQHRFGWYWEPAYEYNFGRGHKQSAGMTGGLLIGIR